MSNIFVESWHLAHYYKRRPQNILKRTVTRLDNNKRNSHNKGNEEVETLQFRI